MIIFTAILYSILCTLFAYKGDLDRGVIIFLLIDLLVVSTIFIGKSIFKYYKIIDNLIDQMNDHLKQREKIIEGVRKSFAFDHVKSAFYMIQYFKTIGLKDQIKDIRHQLVTFGVQENIANNDNLLSKFLLDLGQQKYQITVDSKNKRFIFTQKQTENEIQSQV